MILYVLIGLSLVLLGIAGLQFTYLFYLDRLDRERKKHIKSLESECIELKDKLDKAERQIDEQKSFLAATIIRAESEDEIWADVIEER